MEYHGILVFKSADELRHAVVMRVRGNIDGAGDVAADVVVIAHVDDCDALGGVRRESERFVLERRRGIWQYRQSR